ncbi:MAG: hypothetical protein AAFY45_10730 [Bacteroidota bacterium]
MKTSLLLLSFALFFVNVSLSQYLSESELENQAWTVDNRDSSFFKSDTVSFFRILKFNYANDSVNQDLIRVDYNEGGNLSNLFFGKKNNLKLEEFNVGDWLSTLAKGKWRWYLEEDEQIIHINLKKGITYSFKILNLRSDIYVREFMTPGGAHKSNIEFLVLDTIRLEAPPGD